MPPETTSAPPTTERPKKRAKKPKDPNRVPVKRERSRLTLAVAALERAEKRRAPMAAKLAGLEAVKANLAKLDDEIVELRAAVVRIMNDAKTPSAALKASE